MQYLTKDAFSQAIRDGESMGIPKATTYKSLKQKGYTIEGEPKDSLSPEKSGGVFNYFTDVLKNGAREVGAVVKFGGQVLTDPSKGLEFGRDAFKGAATLAVGAGENIYEKVTGNQVPIFNPDGTTTYPEKSIYEDPIRGGTPEQRVASGLGKNLIESVYSPSGGVFEGKGFTLPETFKKHPLSTLSVAAPLASGVLGRTSTLAKTGAMVEKGRGLAGAAEAAGMAKTAKALSTAGKVSAAVDPMNAAVNVVTKGPGAVAKYGKGLLGAATGAGDESIKIAAQAHGADSAFYQGMRGDVLEQGRILANDSRKAIAALKTQRSKQYLQTKEALTNIMEPLSGEPIYSKLSKTMKEFGITNAEKEILDTMIGMSDDQATAALNSMLKIGDGKLSPLVKAGIGEGPTASKISKAINYVENWDDFTPASLDNLQQALTTIGAKPGTREFVFIDKLKKGVQAVVKDKYPEYTKLLSDYSDASNFIDEIEGAIGAGSKADVEKVVLKMSQTMKTGNMRFEIKNSLVKQLEELTGLPLRERIAGMSLAEYYPRGLAKVGAGMGTAGAVGFGGLSVFTAPSFWMAVGMSSPRVVGEILGAIGVAKSYIPTIVDRLKKVMPFDDVLRSDNAVRALSLSDDADDLPLSTFSPQGVKDAAKMDDLVKGGMTPQEAAKSLNVPKTPKLTAAEKASLTPEERATGLIGGSDSVGGGGMTGKFEKLLRDTASNKRSLEPVGKVGDMFNSSEIKNYTQDIADIPVYSVTRAELDGANGVFRVENGKPKILISSKATDLEGTLAEEIVHAKQWASGRVAKRGLSEAGIQSTEDFASGGRTWLSDLMRKETGQVNPSSLKSPLPSVGGAKDFKMQYPDSTNNPLYEKYSSAKETMMNAAKKDPSNPALDSLKKNMDNAFNEWESVYSKPKPSPVGGGLEPLMKEARITTDISGNKVEMILAKKATATEMKNSAMRQRTMGTLPEKSGYEKVYKAYPKDEAGFYYTKKVVSPKTQ